MGNTEAAILTPIPPATSDRAAAAAMLDSVQQVLAALRADHVAYCVLRNRDRIPDGLLAGSDVDLIVPAGIPPRRLVQRLAGLRPTQVAVHHATVELFFPVGTNFLHIDLLIADRQWRGASYLRNDAILRKAWDDDGIPVASRVHQAFCAWFSSLLRVGRFKPRYIPLITQACQESPAEMQALLQGTFGQKLGHELFALAAQGQLDQCDRYANRCRRALWWGQFFRRPVQTLWGWLRHRGSEAGHWLRPAGLSVAILGPDGAGKSGVCQALADLPRASLPFRRVEPQHLYRRALPLLSELRRGRVRRTAARPVTVHDPHGKRPHHPLVSLLTLTYATVDQWLSRYLWTRGKLAENWLLLHDRHMLELVVDPRRFRYGGPRWLARVFSWLLPKPDLVIVLDAPADVLQARKQEVPFDETARQRQAYRQLIEKLPHGRIVDASRPLDEVVAEVLRQIVAFLAARTAERNGWGATRR